MKEIIKNILNSLDNQNTGYSGKKLSALVVILCVVASHIKWLSLGNFAQLEMVLTIDFTFICTMFGINVADKKLNKNE